MFSNLILEEGDYGKIIVLWTSKLIGKISKPHSKLWMTCLVSLSSNIKILLETKVLDFFQACPFSDTFGFSINYKKIGQKAEILVLSVWHFFPLIHHTGKYQHPDRNTNISGLTSIKYKLLLSKISVSCNYHYSLFSLIKSTV